ncbi:MAG TPA: oxygen-independent coproporphyrinogen III oxidase [Candidatus Polarisedimenticolaceae bacterium]|nr:oxygen-independent coproporphyrinogen III oxidase [Candidatus Polarisedimenticolaceae bacterium]
MALLERYDRPGPRYTSYPTAVEFHEGVDDAVYRSKLEEADKDADAPLSLYAHLPFCEARCFFCGCNVVITRHRDVAARYLGALDREIDLLAAALPRRRRVSQMHWGGGTPTYFEAEQMETTFRHLAGVFAFDPDAEIGVEVDPRVTTPRHLESLRRLGFNRLSLGVQDFDHEVQAAVNRVQSYDQTRDCIELGRKLGFQSINVDLIYGLPYQRVDTFETTLERVIGLRPGRVAVYSFAFVPWIRAHMKHLPQEAMPAPETKLALLRAAARAFTSAGYLQIGMDHFALPDDDMGKAALARTLHRNFMGYSTQAGRDMVALGVSGIGDVKGALVQNVKTLTGYYQALEAGRFPIERGYVLDDDDRIRRYAITELMCRLRLEFGEVARQFGVDPRAYFARELAELSGPGSPAEDGLVTLEADAIDVTELGRQFVRNVCMIFDRHHRARGTGGAPVFSRTV